MLEEHGPDRLTVSYSVQLDDLKAAVKPGQGWTLRWRGGARCRQCRIEITGQREYCYHCFTSLARCDLCVMSPERCHHHEGTCREPQWGDAFCMKPHTVYLALSSVPKVGITRQGRERRRWADQGAYCALPLMQVPSRRLAGVLERACARWVTDRTDWRRLVTGQRGDFSLTELAKDIRGRLPPFAQFSSKQIPDSEIEDATWVDVPREVSLTYPVEAHSPPRQFRINADHPELTDNLVGAIGGYLLFTQGVVPISSMVRGDVELEIGEPVVLEERSQLSLF